MSKVRSAPRFKKGDIICKHTYPGRDHWQQVCEVIDVSSQQYTLRPIQFRSLDKDWSTLTTQSNANFLRIGSLEEDETTLFTQKTLEAEKEEQTAELRMLIRQTVREELALLGFVLPNSSKEQPFE